MSPIQIALALAVIAGVALILVLGRSLVERSQPVRPSDIQLGPICHQALSEELVSRIRAFESVFTEVYPRSHEEWLDGFQRDVHPEREVAIWEAMATAYQHFTDQRDLTIHAKKEAFGLLVTRSAGDHQRTLAGATLRHLSRSDAEVLLRLYSATPQPIVYEPR